MNKTYFIADIASNHDGSLDRAKHLIKLAKEAGANAVKFQHFKSENIVSKEGFDIIGQVGHQAKWDIPVDEVYRRAEINRAWTEELYKTATEYDIDFMSSPYDLEAVDLLEPYVSAYKVGSGDINYIPLINRIMLKNKPVFIATGASNSLEVDQIARKFIGSDCKLILMHCNTNYTGEITNREYVNLNYLDNLKKYGYETGLSDHCKDNDIIIGAVAKGVRYIERHFTDDCTRGYPDHYFSMDYTEFRNMVNSVRRFEMTLGDGIKKVEANELETRIIQRRAWYAKKNMIKGETINRENIEALRPCGNQMIPVNLDIVGQKLKFDVKTGSPVMFIDVFEQGE